MRLVVVGSGIVGAACADAAAALGAEVIVVDAALPGQATAAGAGIICPWTARMDDPARYSLACAAARRYPDLVTRLAEAGDGDVSYRQVGALYLADGERLEQARDELLARRAGAPEIGEVQVLGQAQARALFPPLGDGRAAVLIGGAARVDGRLLTRALIRSAGRNGAEFRRGQARLVVRTGTPRRSGRVQAGGVQVAGVVVAGELVEADVVVAAAGAWTASFAEPAGVTIAVLPERGQIVHLSVRPADTSRWPVILPSGSGHYLLAFDDSRVVAGATREAGPGFDCRVTPGGLREVLERALEVAPGLASARYLETRAGLRPASQDGRPLLGGVAGVRGLVVATGLGASGLTLGPHAGAIAARVALGLDPGADLAPFDPTRPVPARAADEGDDSAARSLRGP